MKRIVLFIFILTLIGIEVSQAQVWRRERKEFVFGAGATNFLGDLGGSQEIGSDPFSMKDLNWPSTRPVTQIGYRYRLSKETSIKGTFSFGYLYGSDHHSENPVRNNRNIEFRAPFTEFSTQFELLFTKQREGHRYKLRGVKGWKSLNLDSYIFGGVGLLFFVPQGKYLDNRWYNLRPLSTEGQGLIATRSKYSLFQPVIPVGIGFRYAISRYWLIGIEYGLRKTFTDYIDDTSSTYFDNDEIRTQKGDVAAYFADPSKGTIPSQTVPGQQRGDPTDYDSYMFATISLYYKIPRGTFAIPKF